MAKSFGYQWIAKINDEYAGFSNQTIKSFSTYVWNKRTNVKTKEKSNARRVFYQPWAEGDHIFTFAKILGKQAKLFWKGKIPIREIDKVQHFVEQMIE